MDRRLSFTPPRKAAPSASRSDDGRERLRVDDDVVGGCDDDGDDDDDDDDDERGPWTKPPEGGGMPSPPGGCRDNDDLANNGGAMENAEVAVVVDRVRHDEGGVSSSRRAGDSDVGSSIRLSRLRCDVYAYLDMTSRLRRDVNI